MLLFSIKPLLFALQRSRLLLSFGCVRMQSSLLSAAAVFNYFFKECNIMGQYVDLQNQSQVFESPHSCYLINFIIILQFFFSLLRAPHPKGRRLSFSIRIAIALFQIQLQLLQQNALLFYKLKTYKRSDNLLQQSQCFVQKKNGSYASQTKGLKFMLVRSKKKF